MRTPVLIALILPLAACSTTADTTQPYAAANTLMRQEIQARISEFSLQHGAELLNNMLWLHTKAGETAIVDLVEALKHENPKVRSSALWVLGRIRDRRTVPQIRPLASDKHAAVRLEAARTLVTMGDLKYCTILIEGLDSGKTPIRYHCHMALKDATRKDFQYDHLEEDLTVRRTATLRWREWWSSHSSDPWFAASYARQHGLSSGSLGANPKPMGEAGTPKTPDTGTTPKPDQGTQPPAEKDPFKPLPVTPKAATPKAATPKAATPKAATPKATTPKTADPKTTTPKTADPKTTTPKTTEKPAKAESPIFKLLDLEDEAKTSDPKTTTPKTTTPGTTTPTGTTKETTKK